MPFDVIGSATADRKAYASALRGALVAQLLRARRDVVETDPPSAWNGARALPLNAKKIASLLEVSTFIHRQRILVGSVDTGTTPAQWTLQLVDPARGDGGYQIVVKRPPGLDDAWVAAASDALLPLLPEMPPPPAEHDVPDAVSAPGVAESPSTVASPGAIDPLLLGGALASSAVAGAGLGLGVALGLHAWSDSERAVVLPAGSDERLAVESSARARALGADASYVVAIVGAAAGAALTWWIVAPPARAEDEAADAAQTPPPMEAPTDPSTHTGATPPTDASIDPSPHALTNAATSAAPPANGTR